MTTDLNSVSSSWFTSRPVDDSKIPMTEWEYEEKHTAVPEPLEDSDSVSSFSSFSVMSERERNLGDIIEEQNLLDEELTKTISMFRQSITMTDKDATLIKPIQRISEDAGKLIESISIDDMSSDLDFLQETHKAVNEVNTSTKQAADANIATMEYSYFPLSSSSASVSGVSDADEVSEGLDDEGRDDELHTDDGEEQLDAEESQTVNRLMKKYWQPIRHKEISEATLSHLNKKAVPKKDETLPKPKPKKLNKTRELTETIPSCFERSIRKKEEEEEPKKAKVDHSKAKPPSLFGREKPVRSRSPPKPVSKVPKHRPTPERKKPQVERIRKPPAEIVPRPFNISKGVKKEKHVEKAQERDSTLEDSGYKDKQYYHDKMRTLLSTNPAISEFLVPESTEELVTGELRTEDETMPVKTKTKKRTVAFDAHDTKAVKLRNQAVRQKIALREIRNNEESAKIREIRDKEKAVSKRIGPSLERIKKNDQRRLEERMTSHSFASENQDKIEQIRERVKNSDMFLKRELKTLTKTSIERSRANKRSV